MIRCETVRARLPDLALGDELSANESADLRAHLRACPACAEEADGLARLTAALPAPRALGERILATTRSGRPLASFAGALARVLDWSVERSRALLEELSRPGPGDDGWRPGFVAGNRLRPVRPGPAHGTSMAMVLCSEPGVVLPDHRHRGVERTFVLQGGYRDSAGTEVWVGEHHEMADGSSHSLRVLPGEPCIAAVLCVRGLVAL